MNTTTDPRNETPADAFDLLMRENAEQAAEIARLTEALESMPYCKLRFKSKKQMKEWDAWSQKVYDENKTIWRTKR